MSSITLPNNANVVVLAMTVTAGRDFARFLLYGDTGFTNGDGRGQHQLHGDDRGAERIQWHGDAERERIADGGHGQLHSGDGERLGQFDGERIDVCRRRRQGRYTVNDRGDFGQLAALGQRHAGGECGEPPGEEGRSIWLRLTTAQWDRDGRDDFHWGTGPGRVCVFGESAGLDGELECELVHAGAGQCAGRGDECDGDAAGGPVFHVSDAGHGGERQSAVADVHSDITGTVRVRPSRRA